MHNPKSGECDTKTFLGFWDTDGSSDLSQTTRPYDNQQKKIICRIVDFWGPHGKIGRKRKEG